MELAVDEIVQRGHRHLVAQQRFRRHHDQRLAAGAQHLPAQHVEHLRRRGRHADLHVLDRAQLQIALEARRGMFGTLAFVAVRQQQHDAAEAAPLGFARGDELVDDDLGAVGEIAELRFPDHQRVRLGRGVAVFEGHHRFFAEQRVDDLDVGVGADGLQRHVVRAAFLVVHDRMAMEERAATGVLADQAQVVAVGDQACRRRGSRQNPSRSAACRRPSLSRSA